MKDGIVSQQRLHVVSDKKCLHAEYNGFALATRTDPAANLPPQACYRSLPPTASPVGAADSVVGCVLAAAAARFAVADRSIRMPQTWAPNNSTTTTAKTNVHTRDVACFVCTSPAARIRAPFVFVKLRAAFGTARLGLTAQVVGRTCDSGNRGPQSNAVDRGHKAKQRLPPTAATQTANLPFGPMAAARVAKPPQITTIAPTSSRRPLGLMPSTAPQ